VKRSALILLTVIYVVSCLGISIDRFYCCGKLASITVAYGAADNSTNTAGKNNKCCKHETQSLKLNDRHFNTASLCFNQPLPQIVSSFISLNNEAIVSVLHTKIFYKGNAPPGHSDIPVYTLNCAYRI